MKINFIISDTLRKGEIRVVFGYESVRKMLDGDKSINKFEKLIQSIN